jgi:hypothetical protein
VSDGALFDLEPTPPAPLEPPLPARRWTAADVKEKLRGHHSAIQWLGKPVPGAWTCVEEWERIDLLAISAHRHPPKHSSKLAPYPRVGYEVKVTRGDMRADLLDPSKREHYHQLCNRLFYAVPLGLLTPAEIAWEEPDDFSKPGAFERRACPGRRCTPVRKRRSRYDPPAGHFWTDVGGQRVAKPCLVCDGRGYLTRSLVEQTAPTLWVPRDVGLAVVSERGVSIVRRAPWRETKPLTPHQLADLLRWVSFRPDPRHVALAAGAQDLE